MATTPQSPNSAIPAGAATSQTYWGDYSQLLFIVQQTMNKMKTSTLVKVVSCTNDGGLSPVGFVDVVPLVNQIDSQGIGVPYTTIFNVPYCRIQGGANAVIIDPQPGDIGLCCFASRDITKVKSTKTQANPGSLRKYSLGDGLYVGGMLNGTPSQYIQFNSSGINITSPTQVTITAPIVEINADTVEINADTSVTINTPQFTVNGMSTFNGITTVNDDLQINGGITQGAGGSGSTADLIGPLNVQNQIVSDSDVIGNGVSLFTHVHSGVTPGGANSGPPV